MPPRRPRSRGSFRLPRSSSTGPAASAGRRAITGSCRPSVAPRTIWSSFISSTALTLSRRQRPPTLRLAARQWNKSIHKKWASGGDRTQNLSCNTCGQLPRTPVPDEALAKGAVEDDFGEGALENGELLVVQLRKE